MAESNTDEILALAAQLGIVSAKDLGMRGLPRRYLSRLADRGDLDRVGRGLYALPDRDLTEHHDLAVVARRLPDAVICLLSALRFHDLTTQAPFEVWIALQRDAWEPSPDSVPVRAVRMAPEALAVGVERHDVGRVSVQVFSPAKTVADCFKYRNVVGLDVALEALQEFRQARREHRSGDSTEWTVDALWRYADACRVQNVIRPYLEAVGANG